MSDPRVSITGPYDANGNLQGRETKLYLSNEAEARTETETKSQDVAGQDSDKSILSPLEASRDFSYKGETSGLYLMREGYGSTPQEAVREYIFELESLVLPYQAAGYTLEDKENSTGNRYTSGADTKSVLVEEISWTYKDGENVKVEWDISVKQGEGVQEGTGELDRQEYIDNQRNKVKNSPTDQIEYNGNTISLGNPEKISVNRNVDINAQQMLHNTDLPQTAVVESGVKEEVRMDGTVTDQKADIGVATGVNNWAETLTFEAHGNQADVTESLTGRPFTGTLEDTSTTFEEGRPRALDYSLTFKVGTDLFDKNK